MTKQVSVAALLKAAKRMDWTQVVLNQGPPCFCLEEDGSFCGRAEAWLGHRNGPSSQVGHGFVSLADLLRSCDKSRATLPSTGEAEPEWDKWWKSNGYGVGICENPMKQAFLAAFKLSNSALIQQGNDKLKYWFEQAEKAEAREADLTAAANKLRNFVNKFRYRGSDGRSPMSNNFYWPMAILDHQAIRDAALTFVLEYEALAIKPASALTATSK